MDEKLNKPHFDKQLNYDENHQRRSFDTESINKPIKIFLRFSRLIRNRANDTFATF